MKCPRDDTPLQPFMIEARIEIDRCSSCKGVWLDKGELEQIQQTIERDYSHKLDEAPDPVGASYEQARQQTRGPASCPRCGAEMEAREYGYTSQVVIDACPDGCGVWLDNGELQQLEIFYERARADNPLPVSWRLWAGVVSAFRKRAAKKGK